MSARQASVQATTAFIPSPSVRTTTAVRLDRLAIRGGLANTFLFARGWSIGASHAENALAKIAREIEQIAERNHWQLLFRPTWWSPQPWNPGRPPMFVAATCAMTSASSMPGPKRWRR